MNTDETIQLYRVKEVRQWNTNGTVNGTQLPIASADLSIIVCIYEVWVAYMEVE